MYRRWLFATLAWLSAAVATTVVGVAAINSLSAGLLGADQQPLTSEDLQRQLSATPSPQPAADESADPGGLSPAPTTRSVRPPATSPASPAPQPTARVLTSRGGTVLASCTGDVVTLRSWSPAQGFRVDDVHRGPGPVASIEFVRYADHRRDEVHVTVVCTDGHPDGRVSTDN